MGKQAKRDSFNILMWWNDYHLLLLTTLIVTHFLEVWFILADNEVGQVGKVMGNIWKSLKNVQNLDSAFPTMQFQTPLIHHRCLCGLDIR